MRVSLLDYPKNENGRTDVDCVDPLKCATAIPHKPDSSDVKILSVKYFEISDTQGLPSLHDTKNSKTSSDVSYMTNKTMDDGQNSNYVENANISTMQNSTKGYSHTTFSGFNYSSKQKQSNGVGLMAKESNASLRSPKKCTLRRHPPLDYNDSLRQPLYTSAELKKGYLT